MEESLLLESRWYVAVAAAAVAVFLLVWLNRSLPLQNLVLIAISLFIGEGALEFGLTHYSHVLIESSPWQYYLGAALLWTAVILLARRLCRTVLRPWRRRRLQWIWVLVFSSIFTAGFQMGWVTLYPDPFPVKTSAMLALFRGLATAVLLFALSPWFIKKRLSSRSFRSDFAEEPQ